MTVVRESSLKVVDLPVERLRRNPWNVNRVPDDTSRKVINHDSNPVTERPSLQPGERTQHRPEPSARRPKHLRTDLAARCTLTECAHSYQ